MSNSIAYHHVELCKYPVQVLKEDKQIFFDECNKQLVSVTPRGICCTPLEGEKRGVRTYYRCVSSLPPHPFQII
jgi:hypothetical protein